MEKTPFAAIDSMRGELYAYCRCPCLPSLSSLPTSRASGIVSADSGFSCRSWSSPSTTTTPGRCFHAGSAAAAAAAAASARNSAMGPC